MEKYLGIDLGTNSLGWAVVEKNSEGKRLSLKTAGYRSPFH